MSVAAVAASVLAGCQESERDRVKDYLGDANAIQREAAPDFERANRSYARFVRGRLRSRRAAKELRGAERAIAAARGEVAELDPPDDARRLHGLLLAVFDANLKLARQTTQLGEYLPEAARALEPLDEVAEQLRRRLGQEQSPAAQAEALDRYAAGLDRRLAALRATDPPPLLAPAHRMRVRRMAAARDVARQLKAALAAQDAPEVARLLLRFRKLQSRSSRRSTLSLDARRRYARQQKEIARAVRALQRERLRLDRSLD